MVTIDEVITGMTELILSGKTADVKSTVRDAIHYLKNYRDTKEWLDLEKRNYAEAVKNCERTEAKYTQMTLDMNRNDPLTWDELKQMEGKPVWVEWTKTEESYWCFVGEWFDDDEMRIYHMGRDDADYIHKTIYTPDIVRAYKKERTDEKP